MPRQNLSAVILSKAKNLSNRHRMPHVLIPGRGLSLTLALALSLLASHVPAFAQNAPKGSQQLVILDTDIGDDIDDAFALALIERSPELHLLGITTAFGDTGKRMLLVQHFLRATNSAGVPVHPGVSTPSKTPLTQEAYAVAPRGRMLYTLQPAPAFILDQIRQHPGEITLIAIGPQTNLAAAIDKDPATFRKLKRIVMMGGSIDRGYDKPQPEPEWNIVCDIPAAKKVFASGVPIDMMPLDSTMLRFEPPALTEFLSHKTPLNEQVKVLYDEWSAASKQTIPTLYDPMAVAYAIQPELCPTTPMHVSIDDKGMTVRSAGQPNVNACLKSDASAFFKFYLGRTSGR